VCVFRVCMQGLSAMCVWGVRMVCVWGCVFLWCVVCVYVMCLEEVSGPVISAMYPLLGLLLWDVSVFPQGVL